MPHQAFRMRNIEILVCGKNNDHTEDIVAIEIDIWPNFDGLDRHGLKLVPDNSFNQDLEIVSHASGAHPYH